MVQVVLISESVRLQQMLATYGIQSETPRQVEPILIWPPENLRELGEYLGACERLGLKGRPKRPYGQLGTSKFYRIGGASILCYPLLFEAEEFYLAYDMNSVIDGLNVSWEERKSSWRSDTRSCNCVSRREEKGKSFSLALLRALFSSSGFAQKFFLERPLISGLNFSTLRFLTV